MKLLITLAFATLLYSCNKIQLGRSSVDSEGYTEYIIPQGDHYADGRTITSLTLSEMSFIVKFDSSAVYRTIDAANQFDINKLYGFSEGMDPHVNSARIGWNWNNGALRLYAYSYKNGVVSSAEICAVEIGPEITCSIILQNDMYIFRVNHSSVSLPRCEGPLPASGYRLFPYFGGDEVSPHDIKILIKDLPSSH